MRIPRHLMKNAREGMLIMEMYGCPADAAHRITMSTLRIWYDKHKQEGVPNSVQK